MLALGIGVRINAVFGVYMPFREVLVWKLRVLLLNVKRLRMTLCLARLLKVAFRSFCRCLQVHALGSVGDVLTTIWVSGSVQFSAVMEPRVDVNNFHRCPNLILPCSRWQAEFGLLRMPDSRHCLLRIPCCWIRMFCIARKPGAVIVSYSWLMLCGTCIYSSLMRRGCWNHVNSQCVMRIREAALVRQYLDWYLTRN